MQLVAEEEDADNLRVRGNHSWLNLTTAVLGLKQDFSMTMKYTQQTRSLITVEQLSLLELWEVVVHPLHLHQVATCLHPREEVVAIDQLAASETPRENQQILLETVTSLTTPILEAQLLIQ